jgi:hypothetical protein
MYTDVLAGKINLLGALNSSESVKINTGFGNHYVSVSDKRLRVVAYLLCHM